MTQAEFAAHCKQKTEAMKEKMKEARPLFEMLVFNEALKDLNASIDKANEALKLVKN